MKKIIALLLIALLTVSIVACAKKNDKEESDDPLESTAKDDVLKSEAGLFEFETTLDGDYEIVKFTSSSVKPTDITLPQKAKDGRQIVGIGDSAFKAQNLKSIKIPESYTYISDYAFYDCDSLTTVTMADNILSIGKYSFGNCDALKEITFSKSLNSIGIFAFEGCKTLTSADLSASVKTIGDGAFFGCKALTSVKLPNNITSINKYTFSDCKNIEYTVENGAKYLGNDENNYLVLISAENLNIKSCTVNNNTQVIAHDAFSNCDSLKTIILGNSVKVIDGDCFKDAKELEFNKFEETYYLGTSDNKYAVLISVTLPSIESAHVHKDTKIITDSAFANCPNLRTISYENTNDAWNKILKTENWSHGNTVNIIFGAN